MVVWVLQPKGQQAQEKLRDFVAEKLEAMRVAFLDENLSIYQMCLGDETVLAAIKEIKRINKITKQMIQLVEADYGAKGDLHWDMLVNEFVTGSDNN